MDSAAAAPAPAAATNHTPAVAGGPRDDGLSPAVGVTVDGAEAEALRKEHDYLCSIYVPGGEILSQWLKDKGCDTVTKALISCGDTNHMRSLESAEYKALINNHIKVIHAYALAREWGEGVHIPVEESEMADIVWEAIKQLRTYLASIKDLIKSAKLKATAVCTGATVRPRPACFARIIPASLCCTRETGASTAPSGRCENAAAQRTGGGRCVRRA